MNDYELVIKRCKTLEALLEKGLGASGRGLYEKAVSIESLVSNDLLKKILYIARVRNRLCHDLNQEKLENRNKFVEACDDAEKSLKLLMKPAIDSNGVSIIKIVQVVVVLVFGLPIVLGLCGGLYILINDFVWPLLTSGSFWLIIFISFFAWFTSDKK